MSMPKVFDIELRDVNSKIVESIEQHAQNNIQYTLDGVFDFLNNRRDYHPTYRVFKEYFVMCWSGQKKNVRNQTFYSRVDIALINEQVRLFYSTLDEVEINYDADCFKIIEYVNLGLNGQDKYLKLEETCIEFSDHAQYSIETKLLFKPPIYDKKTLHHVFNTNNAIIEKLKTHQILTEREQQDLKNIPITYLICHFNGFTQALKLLESAKPFLAKYSHDLHKLYKESLRILRKVKYN